MLSTLRGGPAAAKPRTPADPVRISVVIPTYNAAATVAEAVRSVLAQTRPADEVIVVDDGSTDETASALAAFGPPVRVIRQANGGVSSARNRGVGEATGVVIAFLDADDFWHPRKLERQVPVLLADPALGLLGTGTFAWPGAVPTLAEPLPPARPVALTDLVVRNAFAASSVVARADVLRAAGEFDTRQQGTEDYDLWLRVAQFAAVANLPTPLTGYRVATAGSLSKNAARMEAGMRLILGKLAAAGVFAGKPRLRARVWGYFHYSCGYMHSQARDWSAAAGHLARSLTRYPLAYSPAEVRHPFGRLRLLAACAVKTLTRRGAAR